MGYVGHLPSKYNLYYHKKMVLLMRLACNSYIWGLSQ